MDFRPKTQPLSRDDWQAVRSLLPNTQDYIAGVSAALRCVHVAYGNLDVQ